MLKNIRNWTKSYAKPGCPDVRAMQDFVECEAEETIKALMSELNGIKNLNYDDAALRPLLGQGRIAKHKSYSEWAGLMMLAIAQYRKQ